MLSKGTLARWDKIVRSFQNSHVVVKLDILIEQAWLHGQVTQQQTDMFMYIFQIYSNTHCPGYLSLLYLDNSPENVTQFSDVNVFVLNTLMNRQINQLLWMIEVD